MLKTDFLLSFLSPLKNLTTQRDFDSEWDMKRHYEFYQEHPKYPNQEPVMIKNQMTYKVPLTDLPWEKETCVQVFSKCMIGFSLSPIHLILRDHTYIDRTGDCLNNKELEMNAENLAKLREEYKISLFNAESIVVSLGGPNEYYFTVHWDQMKREDFVEEVSLDVSLSVRAKMIVGEYFKIGLHSLQFDDDYLSIVYWEDEDDNIWHADKEKTWYYTKDNVQNAVEAIKLCM